MRADGWAGLSARELAGALPMRDRLVAVGVGLLLWASLALLVLSTLTVTVVSAYPSAGATAPARGLDGTASVTACRGHDACTAQVSTPDGDLGPVEFRAGELTRADLGGTVAVRPDDGEWVRDVAHPYGFLFWLQLALLLVALSPLLIFHREALGFMAFSSTLRFRLSSEQRGIAAHRVRRHRARRDGPPLDADGAVIVRVPPYRPGKAHPVVLGMMAALGLLAVTVTGGSAYVLGGSPFRLGPAHLPLALLLLAALLVVAMTGPINRTLNEVVEGVPEMRLYQDGIGFDLWSGERRLISWAGIERFTFVENQHSLGRDTVTAHVASTDTEVLSRWPAFGHEDSPYGRVVSSSMTAEDAVLLSAAAERARPGMARWSRPEVRRGGLGLVRAGRRAAYAVRRRGRTAGGEGGRRARVVATTVPDGQGAAGVEVPEVLVLGPRLMTFPRRIWLVSLALGWFMTAVLLLAVDDASPVVLAVLWGPLSLLLVVHLLASIRGRSGAANGLILVSPTDLTWQRRGSGPVRVPFDDLRQVVVDAVPSGFAYWLGLPGRTSVRVVPAVGDFARRYPELPAQGDEFRLIETVSGGTAARLTRAVAEIRSEKTHSV
ncbi:hypothetical protein CFN78_13870 [Amycolatopsis antarctica]|uniref:PH domain-containing protein n=1 Tax=Amycolatopsis antarctica TaxID=1854586 RepID=A0A263D3B7_9PSEU|nr:DUF6346 domain-containing protein [Amycolatopsis antarctica]OZM72709.1 hypothetical protein CFN78_13870 [Amycolatopsis antarctica]